MRIPILALVTMMAFFAFSFTAHAQDPTPEATVSPADGSAFNFEPYDYDTTKTGYMVEFRQMFVSPEFFNGVGRASVTIFKMVDDIAFISMFLIILLAFTGLDWIYGFVTGIQSKGVSVDMTGSVDRYIDERREMDEEEYWRNRGNPDYDFDEMVSRQDAYDDFQESYADYRRNPRGINKDGLIVRPDSRGRNRRRGR